MTDLTCSLVKNILSYDADTGYFVWLIRSNPSFDNKGERAGGLRKDAYIDVSIYGKKYLAHRLAWLYMTSEWPKAQIDHINMNRSDNRFCNLREATHSQNQWNRTAYINNTSGFKGVYKKYNYWVALVHINGKSKYLGQFKTKEDAHMAYCKAAEKHYGEFSRTE